MNIPFRVDPEFFIFPYLKNQGLLPYTQIIDQHFPGGFFLPINFATLGFTSPEAFQHLHILIVSLISLLIFKITKKYSAVILFLILWSYFDGGHLWIDTFITLSLLSSYYFFLHKKYYLTGLSLAFGLLFKQTLLLPILFISIFSLKILIFPALLICYLLSAFPLKDFWYWTFAFNFSQYRSSLHFDFPKWLLIFLPTLTLIKKHPWLFIFILFSLPGFIVRPDLVHLQPAAPFLILLLFYFIEEYVPYKKLSYTLIISLLIIILIKRTNFNQPYYSYFDPNTVSVISYLKSHTVPNQEIFLLGVQPHIYAFSHTLPVGKYFAYQLPWYLQNTENKQLEILLQNPPQIIVYDTSASVDNTPITFYASKLIRFLLNNYKLTNSIGNYHIYEKINL